MVSTRGVAFGLHRSQTVMMSSSSGPAWSCKQIFPYSLPSGRVIWSYILYHGWSLLSEGLPLIQSLFYFPTLWRTRMTNDIIWNMWSIIVTCWGEYDPSTSGPVIDGGRQVRWEALLKAPDLNIWTTTCFGSESLIVWHHHPTTCCLGLQRWNKCCQCTNPGSNYTSCQKLQSKLVE